MSAADPIVIERDALYRPEVDTALARNRSMQGRTPVPAHELSLWRRLSNNSLVYLPAAALLATVLAFSLLEPNISDRSRASGQVAFVNNDSFDYGPGVIALVIDDVEVIVAPGDTVLAPGPDGERAIPSASFIQVGDVVEVVGMELEGAPNRMYATALRPVSAAHAAGVDTVVSRENWALLLMFPITAAFIAFCLLVAEGASTRNWRRMVVRSMLGTLLAVVFSLLAYVPAGVVMRLAQYVLESSAFEHSNTWGVESLSTTGFMLFTACRGMAWAVVGAGLGIGMNLVRSTRNQLRNSVIGGAMGGAIGGMFFDPLDRFVATSQFTDVSVSRLVGLLGVGLMVGLFIALVDRLSREAWVRVRTGPLAGKAFVLYKTPTSVGSSPDADIYLFKDAEIDPVHLHIHRVGNAYEIEDLDSRTGTRIADRAVRRRRLASGDQITIGGTVLEFEERQKRAASPAYQGT